MPECENSQGEILGYDRVKNAIIEAATNDSDSIKSSLIKLGDDWLADGKNEDDITFMVIKKN